MVPQFENYWPKINLQHGKMLESGKCFFKGEEKKNCTNCILVQAWHAGNRLGYVCNPRSLKEGTETSRRMTDEIGISPERPSTSSVTKRANGHWHAITASSCR